MIKFIKKHLAIIISAIIIASVVALTMIITSCFNNDNNEMRLQLIACSFGKCQWLINDDHPELRECLTCHRLQKHNTNGWKNITFQETDKYLKDFYQLKIK